MAAKLLLPIFGGAPGVWTAAMLFFQIALLGGYAYAHFSHLKLGASKQRFLQIGLFVLALLTLPVTTSSLVFDKAKNAATDAGQPALLVLGTLALTVGAGYFVVSTSSTVLQRWFATTDDPNAKDPYFMYALSNLGSMIGLFAYPFIIEPRFGLVEQATLWRTGFIILMILTLGCSFFVKAQPELEAKHKSEITWKQRGFWVLLAAIPSSLLLGATSYISSNIAPIPLIWIVPLALYLLTFIFAFAKKPLVTSAQLSRYFPLILVPLVFIMCIEATEPIGTIAPIHLVVFFAAAWMCHSRLADSRPDAKDLTEFYMWLSVGGAVGGLFNSLVAPNIFSFYAEYPIAICAACALRSEANSYKKNWEWFAAIAVVSLIAMFITKSALPPSQLRGGLAIGVPLALAFVAMDRVKVFAGGIAIIFLGVNLFQVAAPGNLLTTKRSFFGVHRVLNSPDYKSLVHGNTTHGRQSNLPGLENLPLTYYHPTGPVGQFMTMSPILPRIKKIGMVGLGVGSLAAYGRPDQEMTFFEIDPEVLWLARDSGYFSFLKNAKAKMRYVLGDARLTLAREPDQSYDLLILDAFSSDAIPTHLLTQEAIAMYEKKLAPGGVILFHISNRYLELAPVVALTCRKLNMFAYSNVDSPVGDEEKIGKTQSHWLAILRDTGERNYFFRPMHWNEIDIEETTKEWTDDYVNVLGAFAPGE